MIEWSLFRKKFLFSVEGTLLLGLTNGLLNFPQYVFMLHTSPQWEDWETFLWFVSLHVFLLPEKPYRNNYSVTSYCRRHGAAWRREVLTEKSSPPRIWCLTGDGHVSQAGFSPSVERGISQPSLQSWRFCLCIAFPQALRWKWKEIMAFIKAIIERQSFVRKDRSLWLSNCCQGSWSLP